MKIAVFGLLYLVLVVAAGNLDSPLNDGRNLQEIYDNATAWTWTQNITTGGRVKRQANCFSRWMDFSNGRSHPGWDLQNGCAGYQHSAMEGWTLHSTVGVGELYCDYLLVEPLIYFFFVLLLK